MTTENLNIRSEELLPTPRFIKEQLPLRDADHQTVVNARDAVKNILDGIDRRLFVVVGPCSIHDPISAIEYAERLKELSAELNDKMLLLMRVYFEKPRTVVGWKGYINDPYLNDSFKINEGLFKARDLLVKIAKIGLPVATEALDPISPQYLDDLIAWYAIGARTTESQTHREMASGLSTPVGFKNGTDGNIQGAINAMLSARQPHHFLGINQDGQCTVLQTKGNPYGHVVLRGGTAPNYDAKSIAFCIEELQKAKLPERIMIDCSHGNSLKNHNNQPKVFQSCIDQICEGNKAISGVMIESHIFAGNQSLVDDPTKLKYGVSITDACIDWDTTQSILRSAAARL